MKEIKYKIMMVPTDRRVSTDVFIADGDFWDAKDGEIMLGRHLGQLVKPQHLYIVTDGLSIRKGDQILTDGRNHINQDPIYKGEECIGIENGWIYGSHEGMGVGHNPTWTKKIIASTNTMSSVPLLPLSIINQFVNSQGKDNEVWIEMEICAGSPKFDENDESTWYVPKLNDCGEVIPLWKNPDSIEETMDKMGIEVEPNKPSKNAYQINEEQEEAAKNYIRISAKTGSGRRGENFGMHDWLVDAFKAGIQWYLLNNPK